MTSIPDAIETASQQLHGAADALRQEPSPVGYADLVESLSHMAHTLADALHNLPSPTPGAPAPVQPAPAQPSPPAQPTPTSSASRALYVDPASQAAAHGHMRLAGVPQAVWVTAPGDLTKVKAVCDDAKAKNQIAQFAVYFIPNRDNGGASSGGAADEQSYMSFIDQLVQAIGSSKPIVVLEPDALAEWDGVDKVRAACLTYAGDKLTAAGAQVFLDCGHSAWLSTEDVVRRVLALGKQHFTGLAFNVSSYRPDSELDPYVTIIRQQLGNPPVVIDTSRNGLLNPTSEWDNQYPVKFGGMPSSFTNGGGYDLWAKRPGESDGPRNPFSGNYDAPPAGQWFEELATATEKNSGWS